MHIPCQRCASAFANLLGPVIITTSSIGNCLYYIPQIAKRRLAEFVGAKEGDIVHMTNATAAVNTVLLSTPLRKSDLLLITSITYPAVSFCEPLLQLF